MFDPAVLGTAMIGLEAIRRDRDRTSPIPARPARPARSRRPGRARRLLAAGLRWTAERIAPAPLPAAP